MQAQIKGELIAAKDNVTLQEIFDTIAELQGLGKAYLDKYTAFKLRVIEDKDGYNQFVILLK